MNPERFALLEEARRSLPDGFKVELSGDTIVMMVSPSGIHQRNLLLVRRQFDAHAPLELLPSENTDLLSPNVGKSRNPDLTYLPSEVLETTDNQVPAEAAAVAVELVSPSTPRTTGSGRSATTRRWASRSTCWSTRGRRPSPCSAGPTVRGTTAVRTSSSARPCTSPSRSAST